MYWKTVGMPLYLILYFIYELCQLEHLCNSLLDLPFLYFNTWPGMKLHENDQRYAKSRSKSNQESCYLTQAQKAKGVTNLKYIYGRHLEMHLLTKV